MLNKAWFAVFIYLLLACVVPGELAMAMLAFLVVPLFFLCVATLANVDAGSYR